VSVRISVRKRKRGEKADSNSFVLLSFSLTPPSIGVCEREYVCERVSVRLSVGESERLRVCKRKKENELIQFVSHPPPGCLGVCV
jgi:hypothetical protein